MKKVFVIFISFFLSTVFLFSCKTSSFQGNSGINGKIAENSPLDISNTINEDDRYGDMNAPNKSTPKPGGTTAQPGTTNPGTLGEDYTEETKIFEVNCDNYNPEFEHTGNVNTRTIAKVKGKVCGTSSTQTTSSSMNIVFIIDYSASMGSHYETSSSYVNGHDPLVSGSCGRLQGAEKIINSLQSKYNDNQVSISFVGFAGAVETVFQPEAMSKFKSSHLNSSVFCKVMPQTGNKGGTNFTAALTRAKSLLTGNTKPHNVVYFITDGEQTKSLSTDEQAIAAANTLRSSVTNSVINAIYLNSNLTDTRSQNAISLLEKMTLSSSRVKAVSSAAELVDQIGSFSDSSILVETSNYPKAATLSVPGYYSEKDLGIQNIEQNDSTTWTYTTQPFYLVGKQNQTINNVVKVKLQSTDGSTFYSTITIKYTKK